MNNITRLPVTAGPRRVEPPSDTEPALFDADPKPFFNKADESDLAGYSDRHLMSFIDWAGHNHMRIKNKNLLAEADYAGMAELTRLKAAARTEARRRNLLAAQATP